MPTKNWRHIGVVTHRDINGRETKHACLQDALNAMGSRCFNVLATQLEARRPADTRFMLRVERFGTPAGPRYLRDCLFDEYGFEIPAWRLREEAAFIGLEDRWLACRWWRRPMRPEDFRVAPVPGIHKVKGGHGWCRHPHTTAELRENEALDLDDEASEIGLRPRARRNNVPTWYDDLPHAKSGNSWKRYRTTRWKDKG